MNDDEKKCAYCGKMLEVKAGNITSSEILTYKIKGKKYLFCPAGCFPKWAENRNKKSESTKNESMDKAKILPKNEVIDKSSSSFSQVEPKKCDNCGGKIQGSYFGRKVGGKEDKDYWFCSRECLGNFFPEEQNQGTKINNSNQSENTSNQKELASPKPRKNEGSGGLIALILLSLVIVGGIIFYYVGKRKGK